MRRDWQKIKEVLEDIERDRLEAKIQALQPENEGVYFGHLLLVIDGGMAEGIHLKPRTHGQWLYGFEVPRLTFAGHDLLDSIRSNTVWNEVRRRSSELLIPVTTTLIKVVADSIAKG